MTHPPTPEARPRPLPAITHDTRFFWDGIAQRKLLIQRCKGCGRFQHPPGPMCPKCHSLEWEAVPASGRGTLYSFVVFHHPPVPPFPVPNPIGLIELEEGTRVVSNLVGIPREEIRIGMPLRACFPELEPGRIFLQFERA